MRCMGQVVTTELDQSSGRYAVRLEHDGKACKIKSENLRTIQEAIRAIQRNESLNAQSKLKAIQGLHLPPAPSATTHANATSSSERSFHASPPCSHYACECVIVSACCGGVFQCRLCHDEHVSDHPIDRFATKRIICKNCDVEQDVSNECAECNTRFGEYFCAICKLWKVRLEAKGNATT